MHFMAKYKEVFLPTNYIPHSEGSVVTQGSYVHYSFCVSLLSNIL